jgi:hypothetical protein
MKLLTAALLILSAPFLTFANQPQAPKGYRYPIESDYSGDWQNFRSHLPVPFHLQADFNSDELKDDAWILIRNDGKGWAFFVFLSQGEQEPKIIRLEQGAGQPQGFGVILVNPGRYKTACGKGYFECAAGESEWLSLNKPAISFFVYESTESIFYWKPKTKNFQKVRISD